MEIGHKYFFEPRKGVDYEKGYEGLRTLIVGVAHICTHVCPFHALCKSPVSIRKMDRECPLYRDRDSYYRLSNSNEIEICSFIDGDAHYPAYSAFTYYMLNARDVLTSEDKSRLWESVAFTNYLQVYLDNDELAGISDSMSEGAYDSFLEAVQELKPNVIYAWNPLVRDSLKCHPEMFRYLGQADMSFQLSVYVFVPVEGGPGRNELRKLRYSRGISSCVHRDKWYKDLVSRNLGCTIDDPYRKNTVKSIAQLFKDWVESGLLGASENDLYFRNSGNFKWTTCHIAYFVRWIKDKYSLGRGANEGFVCIFNEPDIPKYSISPKKADEIRKKVDSVFRKLCNNADNVR